jgi:hypothetical protein
MYILHHPNFCLFFFPFCFSFFLIFYYLFLGTKREASTSAQDAGIPGTLRRDTSWAWPSPTLPILPGGSKTSMDWKTSGKYAEAPSVALFSDYCRTAALLSKLARSSKKIYGFFEQKKKKKKPFRFPRV